MGIVPGIGQKGVQVLVSCLGDIMLDVLVDAPSGLVPNDDTPAQITFTAGGQAANVAAWVSALGGQARLFGPRTDSAIGRLVDEALAAAGVEVYGATTEQPGKVMSLLTPGSRSMASDPGSSDWLAKVEPGAWLDGTDWLFVSGYALLRSAHPARIVEAAESARRSGTRVAVDLSSASMIADYGAGSFRQLWQALRPAVVFANHDEWTTTHQDHSPTEESVAASFGAGGSCVLVLKLGAAGAKFVIDGVDDHRIPSAGLVLDVTGAGDALAAGYLLGGVDLAMATAARCVAQLGAQPVTTSIHRVLTP